MTEYPLEYLHEVGNRKAAKIRERLQPMKKSFDKRATAILRTPSALASKVRAMWKLADDMLAQADGIAACTRGCSHCCHIAVGVFEHEARVIGASVGRTPANPPASQTYDHIKIGYDNPCPFLRDGQCSIYEHRPMTCRTQLSLFENEEPCRLRPGETVMVPYYDGTELRVVMGLVGTNNPRKLPRAADIREWFPTPNQGNT